MYSKIGCCFPNTRFTQYVSVLIAALGITSAGTYLTWPSPTISKLKSENSPLGEPLNSDETSWIVAVFLLTGLPVALSYHILMGRIGRKTSFQIASVFLFVPWLLIIFGDNVIYVYVARGVAGIVLGIVVITTAMYSAEIADPCIRGRLGTSYGIMKLAGSILVLSVGPFISYTALAIVCGVIPLLNGILLFFIPESPYYLVKTNQLDEARKALAYLSGTNEKKLIDEKLHAIQCYVSTDEKPLTIREVLSNKIYVKVLVTILTAINLEYLGGANAITSYQQEIVNSSKSSISPEVSSIIFGAIQIPAALISAILVDKLGRKVIIYIGGLASVIALVGEGIYFFMEDYMKMDVSSVTWIPTTGIVLYLLSYAVYASIPYILLGEFFTDKIKSVATTIFLTCGVIAVFVVTKTFEPMAEAWGMYTVFWIYAFFSLLCVLFTFFFLPETKNKTFEQIEFEIYR